MGIIDAAGAFSIAQDLSTSATGTTVLSTDWMDLLAYTDGDGTAWYRDFGAGAPVYVVFTVTTSFTATLGLTSALQFRPLVFADSVSPPSMANLSSVIVGSGDQVSGPSMDPSPSLGALEAGARFAVAIGPVAGAANTPATIGSRYLRVAYEFVTSTGVADTLATGAISAYLSNTPDISGPPRPLGGVGDPVVPNVYPASVNRAGNG